jgi:hypothetical protein
VLNFAEKKNQFFFAYGMLIHVQARQKFPSIEIFCILECGHKKPCSTCFSFQGAQGATIHLARLSTELLSPHCCSSKQHQFGFRQKRNTTDSLLFLTQHIHSAWDTNFDLLFISFDIEKAFDSVWIEGLLYKLHFQKKLTGPLLSVIKNFLTQRNSLARMGNHHSHSISPDLGTPQGCVLSPTLFDIFIDDLLSALPTSLYALLYADDSALFVKIPRGNSPLRTKLLADFQNGANQIHLWCKKWRLRLSVPKTTLFLFPPVSTISFQLNPYSQ